MKQDIKQIFIAYYIYVITSALLLYIGWSGYMIFSHEWVIDNQRGAFQADFKLSSDATSSKSSDLET
jgi:hypothetical protein